MLCLLFASHTLMAQKGPNDTIPVGSMVIGNDTLPHIWIRDMFVTAKAPRWLVKERRRWQREQDQYSRLRYNVYLTYPYAVAASYILKDVDSMLHTLQSKDAKKLFKERKEQELNRRFKHELENFSIEQGQILVKLIARQTGKPCYQIVKELKGGFNAGIWQAVALLFNNNLRNTYDAEGDDAMIESIVLEIESTGHFELKK
ncbi:MAG: DUF4294 domain-containing protein [Chitinophagaceae bacterium]|nr:DUF4294 domain-containing protein [Chitinophagaceae bacterium]